MGCFVVTEFLLTIASHGPSAIAEPLVIFSLAAKINRGLHGSTSLDLTDTGLVNWQLQILTLI